jgi:membrane protein
VLGRYNAAAGGLLAGGLAYSALFAIVPAIILTSGLAGILVRDPAVREDIVDVVAGVLPPLRDLISAILEETARDAAPVTIVGIVTLLWGASRFVIAFEECVARVLGDPTRRGFVLANAGAFAAVLAMVAAVLLEIVLAGLAAFLEAAESAGIVRLVGLALGYALGLAPLFVAMLVMALVYRLVPIQPTPWRRLLVPAVVVGLALAILGRVFVFLAPRLIGAAALLGALATAFAALAWLALSFQIILLGAAWIGERNASDRESTAA